MGASKVILGVLLFIAILIIIILIILLIVCFSNDDTTAPTCDDACKDLRTLPMYMGIGPFFNNAYPYYNDNTSCRSFDDRSNWIEFEVTNNTNTGINFFSEKASTNSECTDSTATATLSWGVPATGVVYPSNCMYNGDRFFSLFQNMFLQITASSGANIPISFQGTSPKNEVQLAVPSGGVLEIVASGSSSSDYLVKINIK